MGENFPKLNSFKITKAVSPIGNRLAESIMFRDARIVATPSQIDLLKFIGSPNYSQLVTNETAGSFNQIRVAN